MRSVKKLKTCWKKKSCSYSLSKVVEFKCSMRGEKEELEIGKKQQS